MRWEAHFNIKKKEVDEISKNYSLKSLNCPPQIKEFSAFENELFNLLNIIKFRKVQSKLQRKIKKDIQLINKESKTLTFAEKLQICIS